ncbi:hypothetical protein AA313_de0202074 [Arthrobotrys entomopaga]|nr:hypothetical protein AA313_de0202074 [Arthrobotrys entomopaga]
MLYIDTYNGEQKKPHEVTAELIRHWEDRKRRKRNREPSSSPLFVREIGVSKPVRVAKEDLERYQHGRKRRRVTKNNLSNPIIIDSSQEAAPSGLNEGSVDSTERNVTVNQRRRNSRRRIIDSSQSLHHDSISQKSQVVGEEREEDLENVSTPSTTRQSIVAVEITIPVDLRRCEYVVYPTPDPPSPIIGEDEATFNETLGEAAEPIPSISSISSQQTPEFDQPEIFGVSDDEDAPDVVIQVPLTQSSRKGRREIPDSQSPDATPITIPSLDQPLVPETPLNDLIVEPPSVTRLERIQETAACYPVSSYPSSQLELDHDRDFADIPDSSNRVFSQDVRELKAQSQSTSNGSKDSQNTNHSQQSQNSVLSAQLSFGKIGVTPSFQSFPEEVSQNHAESKESGDNGEADGGLALATKSVARELAPSPNSDQQPFESQTPFGSPNGLLPNQDSTSASISPFVTPKDVLKSHCDVSEVVRTVENRSEEHPSPRRFNPDIVRILQESVESRPASIVEEHPESPSPPAQLENQQSQREGEAIEALDSSSLRNLQPYEPASFGTNFETFPPILSPKTPVREDLQDRSAASTPCGPIPASAKPAPVTVLGYFPPQRSQAPQSEQVSRLIPGSSIPQTSAALQETLLSLPEEKLSPSPSRETRASRKRRLNTSGSGDEIMSAAPASPLLGAVEIANVSGHISPKRQGMATISSGLLSSSQPLSTPFEETANSQKGENAESGGETPAPEALSSINDEYLAASQAFSLIQAPTRSTSTEIFLAIPLHDKQKKLYQETLRVHYRNFEAFVGIQNTQVPNESVSNPLAKMENLVRRLDAIASHCDLAENHTHTKAGPKIISWFCRQSTKFTLISTLLDKLKGEAYSVAIVAAEGLLMDYLEIFMQSGEYSYTRYDENMKCTAPLSDQKTEALQIILLPSRAGGEATLPTVNLIIGMDSTVDSSAAHIQQLQKVEGAVVVPILHLVAINTVAHILLCLPESIKSDPQDYINPLLFASYLIREDVGTLPQNLVDYMETLSAGSPLSWIENLQNTQENILPPLRYDLQNTQMSKPVTQSPVSPARKRVLSLSVAPTSSGGKHKKARIDPSQVSPQRREHTPVENAEDEVSKSNDPAESSSKSELIDEKLALTPSAEPGDITHVTGTLPEAPSSDKLVTVPVSELDEPAANVTPEAILENDNKELNIQIESGSAEEIKGKGVVKQEDEELEDEYDEDLDEEDDGMLQGMNKADLIRLLRSYQSELLKNQEDREEWERHLAQREIDYQAQREKIKDLKEEMEEQAEQIVNLTMQRDRSKAAMETAIQESNQLRDDMKRFQEALLDTPEGERERTKIMLQNMDLNGKVTALERKRKTLEHDYEFLKDRYQYTSQGSSQLLRERDELQAENSALEIKADEIKVQLKALNMDKERSKYQHLIKELRARLDRANKQILTLEAEKKRVERTRGLQTRASSIPPRGAQSSPAPTRPVSPTPVSHRHLLRGMDGP